MSPIGNASSIAVIGDRAFGTRARAIPGFAFGIALAAEQDRFAVLATGDQREHRFGFGKAGQVLEIAVLPVRIVAVVVAQTFRRGRHDADRVAADDAHQLPAAADVFLAVDHGCWRDGEGPEKMK